MFYSSPAHNKSRFQQTNNVGMIYSSPAHNKSRFQQTNNVGIF
jgi:hypothetical protein